MSPDYFTYFAPFKKYGKQPWMKLTTEVGNTSTSQRYYSLDALRATMMLLGVLIHTSVSYMPGPSPVKTLTARHTAEFFTYIVNFIHSYRMEIFFIVAGYFGALLFFRKGPWQMLTNRFTRIVLPLIAAVLILYPAMYFATSYSTLRIAGDAGALEKTLDKFRTGVWLPFRLNHLWFLYDLFIFSLLMCVTEMILNKIPVLRELIRSMARFILTRPLLRILTIAFLFFIGLLLNKEYALHTNVSFWIDWRVIYVYLIFYGVGWMVYSCSILEYLQWKPLLQITTATLLFILSSYLELHSVYEGRFLHLQIINSFVTTLYSLGITALFLQKFNSHSRSISYVMGAAYYVYLIHVPVAMLLPGLWTDLELPVVVEFFLTTIVTTAFAFITYHYLVRNTFVGKFLNGKLIKL